MHSQFSQLHYGVFDKSMQLEYYSSETTRRKGEKKEISQRA